MEIPSLPLLCCFYVHVKRSVIPNEIELRVMKR
jgi:hypothetical protein